MEETIGPVDDIKAVEPFEKSARVEVRFSKINSAMRAVTDLQGLKFFDRPLMLAFSRGGASQSPDKAQPTPPPASSLVSTSQWREREEQTPLTTDEEEQVDWAVSQFVLLYHCHASSFTVSLSRFIFYCIIVTFHLLLYHCYASSFTVSLLRFIFYCMIVTLHPLLYYCYASSFTV
jgi:hypothetical protein